MRAGNIEQPGRNRVNPLQTILLRIICRHCLGWETLDGEKSGAT